MKDTASPHTRYLWLAYVAPMAAFMVLTSAESSAAKADYVWFYLAKVIVVTALLLGFRRPWKDIQPKARFLIPAVLVGLAVCIEWLVLDKLIPYPHLGHRTSLDPFTAIEAPALRSLFLIARFYGLVVMVPVMEELFWRSFLLRYLTNPDDFTKLPVERFSWGAFWMVAVGFGLVHSEWLVAVICACAYALLLRQTRSLFACIVAHGTTNLALGVYIVVTHDWVYW
ncbi:MAG: CAAX prenyl protease-related protein [Chroococcidiopsidaceae cyanobacterium CP_BM_RX_35]|nr:CAAX prenyl protease-related protein [Chroococcidiopsidaceae cyanobacterium CP_BM_RX_35]